jgi:hypothetical protein
VEPNLQLELWQNHFEAFKKSRKPWCVRNAMMLKFEAQTHIYLGGQEKKSCMNSDGIKFDAIYC